ncbi:hypothetical protein CYMTET_18459 [Cymbomonas tetramitiformis]|uniref:SLC26A/SulP transporter domain-containing protein n=1 Tax=Cymbomonas tetramitiformis TaxID=36881 RepID=A0AAE0G808_9CHLO|nr:hypothetical protein CYMTET_18459 [Cymbomonas tetramitiformis]
MSARIYSRKTPLACDAKLSALVARTRAVPYNCLRARLPIDTSAKVSNVRGLRFATKQPDVAQLRWRFGTRNFAVPRAGTTEDVPQGSVDEAKTESVDEESNGNNFGDLMAGITLAFLSIPQGVAYATLAGLPPISGVYANSVAPVVGATLGSSRYLQTGVMSMGAMLSGAAVTGLGLAPGSAPFIAASSLLAVLVGCIRVVLAAVKGGNLVSKVPQTVMHGFTMACVWLVFSTQLPAITGIAGVPPAAAHMIQKAWWVLVQPQNWSLGPVLLSSVSAAIIIGGKRVHALFPGAVVACVLGCAAAAAGLPVGPVVGAVPSGLPTLQLGALLPVMHLIPGLLFAAGAIAVCCFAEGAAISSRLAERDQEEWDANKEVLGSGIAGIASGMFGGLTVSGAISRTSLAAAAGARTRRAAILTGLLVTVFVAAPAGATAIAMLPKATLATLVGVAVLPLLQPTPLLMGNVTDLPEDQCGLDMVVVGWLTVVATLAVAPKLELGLTIGLALACLQLTIRKMLPADEMPMLNDMWHRYFKLYTRTAQ